MMWSGSERAGAGGGSVPKPHRPRDSISNAVPIIMPLEVGRRMTRRKVRLGFVQMRMQEGQEDNLEKGVVMIERAASGGASIVCLPELFTTSTSRSTSRRARSHWRSSIPCAPSLAIRPKSNSLRNSNKNSIFIESRQVGHKLDRFDSKLDLLHHTAQGAPGKSLLSIFLISFVPSSLPYRWPFQHP